MNLVPSLALVLLFIAQTSRGFQSHQSIPAKLKNFCPLRAARVQLEKDEQSVGIALCNILKEEYASAISKGKDRFFFSISGGSMIKMLSNLKGTSSIDWKKCTMGFVSHRCVGLGDDAATYHKARPAFLDTWVEQGLTVITTSGSENADFEADVYEAALKSSGIAYDNGFPVFDLLLIGVGTDGHVGSIYPNQEDTQSQRVVVPVTQPSNKPVKISMSLTTMKMARASVVACAGKSAKAPLGKAEAMVRALEGSETAMSFPASTLRDKALWLLDIDSAVLLKK